MSTLRLSLLSVLVACGTPLDPAKPRAETPDSGEVPADTGPIDTDPEGDFLFADQIVDLELELSAASLAALAEEPREDVPAGLIFAGERWEVALKLKGSRSFRDLSEKASFKIDVQEYDDEQRFFGIKRLTLNSMIQDPTMASERLSYRLHALVGAPAPRHGYARVRVNGELFGLYALVETMDEQLLERIFPGDAEGNLYEGGYGGDFAEGCAPLFTQQEGEDESRADLSALIEELLAASPEALLPTLEARFDAEALFDLWAVELLTSNDDAYTTLGNNFLVYHAPAADRWTMLPWGADQAFAGEPGLPALQGALAVRCAADPACAAALDARVERAIGVWEAEGFADWAVSEADRIEADCRADPRSEWGDYGCRDALEALRAWVRERPRVARDR